MYENIDIPGKTKRILFHMDVAKRKRRLETSRLSQQRYRLRKKQEAIEAEKRIQEMHVALGNLQDYRDILMSSKMVRPVNRMNFQLQIIRVYMDLYSRGAHKSGTFESAIQQRFQSVNFSDSLHLNGGPISVGAKGLHEQWERYTALHPKLFATITKLCIPMKNADIVRLHSNVTLPIRHRSILALYPHMASNPNFLRQSMGRTIVYSVKATFLFNDYNKVMGITVEANTVEAWCNLLQDMNLAFQVVSKSRLQSNLIELDATKIRSVIEEEHRHRVGVPKRGRPRIDADEISDSQLYLRATPPMPLTPPPLDSSTRHSVSFILNHDTSK